MDEKRLISQEERLLKSWLRGRPESTQKAYRSDIAGFIRSVGKPLDGMTLEDIQDWYSSLTGAEASKRRKLASVKSCLQFAFENQFIDRNVSGPVKPAKVQEDLHERILSEDEVLRMIEGEPDARRKVVLRTLCLMGLRNAEASGLKWKDLTRKKQGGTASIFGKGGKTRHVSVPASLWRAWEDGRQTKSSDEPVLLASDGGQLNHEQITRIVRRAAKRAGITAQVTPHWLRHACASHALDNGAPPHVVQSMLGHSSLATTTRYAHVRDGEGTGDWLKG